MSAMRIAITGRPLYWTADAKASFEPRDLRFGIRWATYRLTGGRYLRLRVWICLLPCVPLQLTIKRAWRPGIEEKAA